MQVSAKNNLSVEPWIVSLNVVAKSCVDVKCKYLLLVNGSEFLGHNSWKLTSKEGSRGSYCDTIYPNYELHEVETTQWFSKIKILIPNVNEKIYICLRHNKQKNNPVNGLWIHQGVELYLNPSGDDSKLQENRTES